MEDEEARCNFCLVFDLKLLCTFASRKTICIIVRKENKNNNKENQI